MADQGPPGIEQLPAIGLIVAGLVAISGSVYVRTVGWFAWAFYYAEPFGMGRLVGGVVLLVVGAWTLRSDRLAVAVGTLTFGLVYLWIYPAVVYAPRWLSTDVPGTGYGLLAIPLVAGAVVGYATHVLARDGDTTGRQTGHPD